MKNLIRGHIYQLRKGDYPRVCVNLLSGVE